MSLESTLKEIKALKPIAMTEVEEVPRETLAGRRARRLAAIEKLKLLQDQYRHELLSSSMFIVVTGSERDSFTAIAKNEFGIFTAEADAFYTDLANRIPPVLYEGKESSSNLFDVVGRHLEDKMLDLGIVGYPQLIFKQQYRRQLTSRNDLIALLKQSINEQVGAEVMGVQAIKMILDVAVERSHQSRTTPIALTVSDENVDTIVSGLRRLTKQVFVVSAGQLSMKTTYGFLPVPEVVPKNVAKAMKVMRAALQGRQLSLSDIPDDEPLGPTAKTIVASSTVVIDVDLKDGETTEEAEVRVLSELMKDLPEYGSAESLSTVGGGVLTQEMVEAAATKAMANKVPVAPEKSATTRIRRNKNT